MQHVEQRRANGDRLLMADTVVLQYFDQPHAAALFLVKVLVIDFPNAGGVGLFQFYVTLVLTIVSGALRALLISAITTKEGQSMLLVIGVIVVQVVFSGGVVSLDSLGIAGTVFGSITSTNWAFKALTSSAGLTTDGCSGDFTNCGLPGFSPTERELSYRSVEKGYGGIFDSEVLVAWAAMVANLVGLSVALYLIQKWKDVR